MQLYLKLRTGLLYYFYLAIAGSILLTKPASAQQVQTPLTIEAQAAAKAPSGLLNKLKAGQNQELIVVYDDTKIQKKAASLRRQQALNQENSQILAFKVAQYAKRKQQILSKVGTSGIQVVKDYNHLPLSFVRFQSKAALIRLLASSDVVRVYRNETRTRSLVQSLPLIGQPAVAAAGRTGSGTTVAVLDTGVDYTRPAFGACTSPAQPIGCKVVYAQDFAKGNNQLDDDGHGTNVAGIVASVAPGTQIVALDVFRPRGGRDTDIIAAINWSIQNKSVYNIVAMNLSLGSSTNNTSTCSNNVYNAPFAQARAVGIIPVVAAGNDGFATGISDPACATGAVSVGAVYDSNLGPLNWRSCPDKFTAADIVTCFSNSARILTLLAPGALIDAAGIQQGGTSQAAPHVAGAVAVLRSLFPDDTIDQTISRLTNTGVAIADTRNGIVKPRLNLLAASETVIPQPVNDNFVSATPVNGSLVAVMGVNTNATKETGEVDSARPGGKSVWWSWTAPKSGNVQITTEGSDFDTLLGVYTGADVASTTQVAANDDSSANRTSTVTFNAVAGTTYHIAVDGNNGESGNITLYINATNGADFNNDGKTDILWHRDGYLAVWLMDGVNLTRSLETNPSQASSRNWKPVSTADFNNDGNTDILWRHSAGFLSLWLMDGTKLIRSTNLNPRQLSDLSWKIIGTGDFNRDGNADILWRSDAGFLSIWLMDGENLIAGVELNPNQVTDTSWKPVGTGDFNQDAKVDILWQRDDGALKVWLMDDVNLTSEVNLTPVADTSWKAVSTGDFNRDGKTDILWRNNDGYLSVWFMDGVNLVSSAYLNPDRIATDTIWKPIGVP